MTKTTWTLFRKGVFPKHFLVSRNSSTRFGKKGQYCCFSKSLPKNRPKTALFTHPINCRRYAPLILAPAEGTWCLPQVLGPSGPYPVIWLDTWRMGSFLTSWIILGDPQEVILKVLWRSDLIWLRYWGVSTQLNPTSTQPQLNLIPTSTWPPPNLNPISSKPQPNPTSSWIIFGDPQ